MLLQFPGGHLSWAAGEMGVHHQSWRGEGTEAVGKEPHQDRNQEEEWSL